MHIEKIFDKDISTNNYASFIGCEIKSSGKIIEFTMANGVVYQTSLDYLVTWYSNPHYIYNDGQLDEWIESKHLHVINRNDKYKKIACRYEFILSNTALRLFMNDGTVYDVAWDTVLMALEKNYEHYGGLTDKSKEIISRRPVEDVGRE